MQRRAYYTPVDGESASNISFQKCLLFCPSCTIFLYCTLCFVLLAVISVLFFIFVASHQLHYQSITVEGIPRYYLVHVPHSLRLSSSITFAPLLLVLHDNYANAEAAFTEYNFQQVADSEQFIIVYPLAFPCHTNLSPSYSYNVPHQCWNTGFVNCSATQYGVNDVAFLKELTRRLLLTDTKTSNEQANLAKTYFGNEFLRVSFRKMYMTGFGNGGSMIYNFLHTNETSQFVAVAPISAAMGAKNIDDDKVKIFTPKAPAAILHIHGSEDSIVPIIGGTSSLPTLYGTNFVSLNQSLDLMLTQFQCTPQSIADTRYQKVFKSQNDKVVFTIYNEESSCKLNYDADVMSTIIQAPLHNWNVLNNFIVENALLDKTVELKSKSLAEFIWHILKQYEKN